MDGQRKGLNNFQRNLFLMKPKNRICAALYHEEPDKVPDSRDIVGICSVLDREILISGANFTIWRSPFGSIHIDYVNPSTGSSFLSTSDEWWVAPENFVWWYTIAPAVRWPEDLDKIEPPKIDEKKIDKAKKIAKNLHEKGYFTVISHHTAFDSSWRYLRGLKQWLIDIRRDMQFARRVVEFAIKPQIEITNVLLEETKADAVYVTGDLGTPRGPFISPQTYEELIYPWDQRMNQSYHKRGAFVFIHSHGYIMPLLDKIIMAGFDCINPVSPLCRMSLSELKEKYGDKISFHAELTVRMKSGEDIDTLRYSQILYSKLSREKIDALKYTVEVGAPGGGFIFAHILRGESEEEKAYMREWEKIRRYSKLKS